MDKIEFPKFLTKDEVAEILNVTPDCVVRWKEEGRIRAYKTAPGKAGRLRFSADDLREFIKSLAVAGPDPLL